MPTLPTARLRKRDIRFSERDRYKERFKKEYAVAHGTTTTFTVRQFTMADDKTHCICPAGKRLHRNGAKIREPRPSSSEATRPTAWSVPYGRNVWTPGTVNRQVYFFRGREPRASPKRCDRRSTHSRVVSSTAEDSPPAEPVFANIRSTWV